MWPRSWPPTQEDGTAFVLVRFTQLTGHPTGEIVVLDLGPATPVDL